MHIATIAILLSVACLGHVAITVWLFNRLHALGWPRPLVKSLEKALLFISLITLLVILVLMPGSSTAAIGHSLLESYLAVCWFASALIIPRWLIPKLLERTPATLLSNDTTLVDVANRIGFR